MSPTNSNRCNIDEGVYPNRVDREVLLDVLFCAIFPPPHRCDGGHWAND